MIVALASLALLASEPSSVTGKVLVARGTQEPLVFVVADDKSETEVVGELKGEVKALAGSRLEAIGARDGQRLNVQAYVILDLGGGVKPTLVGTLVEVGGDLALGDGGGSPIPISLAPALKRRLGAAVGGKVWVVGEKLLSGEIKVTRFGVLREPPKATRP